MTKLGLGCAQLGMRYGNSEDLMSETQAISLIKGAYDAGIRFFDTAAAYGLSEKRLQAASLPAEAEICSKIRPDIDEPWLDADIVLIHGFSYGACNVQTRLNELTDAGYVTGLSVYEPYEAVTAAAMDNVSVLEIPVNLLDRRFIEPPIISHAKKKGIRLIARSILLQGILAPEAPLPGVQKRHQLQALRELMKGENVLLDPFRFIFGNLAGIIDVGLVGCNSLAMLQENVDLYKAALWKPLEPDELKWFEDARLYALKHELYDPRTWGARLCL